MELTQLLDVTSLLVLGLVSPLIVSYLTKSSMSSKTKHLIALVVSVVVAILVVIVSGGSLFVFNGDGWENIVNSLLIATSMVFTIQQVAYKFIFKGTEWENNIYTNHGVGKNEEAPLEKEGDLAEFSAEEDPEATETDLINLPEEYPENN